MSSIAPLSPADRFARIMAALLVVNAMRVKASDLPAVPMPVVLLFHARLQRAKSLFAALAERVRLGTARMFTRRASPRRVAGGSASPAASRRDADRAIVPRRFGVVVHHLGWQAAGCAAQLEHLLGDPEMVALVGTAPGFARILRPLLRMLAITPPPGLFPPAPKRPRRRAVAAARTRAPDAARMPRPARSGAAGPARVFTRRVLAQSGPSVARGIDHPAARCSKLS